MDEVLSDVVTVFPDASYGGFEEMLDYAKELLHDDKYLDWGSRNGIPYKEIINRIKQEIQKLIEFDKDEIEEKAPKGWEGTVKAMKKHKEIDNPWALSHWMKGKGAKSHYTKKGKKK